jgi:hypothetical protein
MADWFKFYENDLEEKRLQYAVAQLPEVISVWVGILSEACRHKSDTIRFGSDEVELFGFSRILNVSIPKVNEAINLLAKINYIQREKDSITIIKWHAKQSEYCQKRTKLQNQSGNNNPMVKTNSVGIVSGHSPVNVGQEERRGEEKRGDSTKLPASPAKPSSFKCLPSQKLLIDRIDHCLGVEWENDRQKWMKRIIKSQSKSERVIAELENAIKEGRVTTTPAAYAEDTWKRFA